ncbi:hypothetical protein JZ751_010697, partial [Albula glossodonta]
MYYDSNITKAIPKTEWIEHAADKNYWDTETRRLGGEQQHFSAMIKNKWDNNPTQIESEKLRLTQECIDWLKKYVSYGRNTLERRDGEEVQEGVEEGETLLNGDGTFQITSRLTVKPEDWRILTYTCTVQHKSLEKDIVK